MFDMTDPKLLSLVVPGPRLNDPDNCRRMASRHRDLHLGMVAMAENETNPEGVEYWRAEAADSLRLAEWWEAQAARAEEQING